MNTDKNDKTNIEQGFVADAENKEAVSSENEESMKMDVQSSEENDKDTESADGLKNDGEVSAIEEMPTSEDTESENMDVSSEGSLDTQEETEDFSDAEAYIEYNLTYDEVYLALKQFQKEMQMKKNIIFTVLLIIAFALYVFQIVSGTANSLSMFLAGICVLLLAAVWYMPYHHRKTVAKAAESEDKQYSMHVFSDHISIKHDEGIYKIEFSDNKVQVREFSDLFVIYIGKTNLFILPKRCLEEDQEAFIRQASSEHMGNRYQVI